MTSFEYQNKIVSLLDDLADTMKEIGYTLNEMLLQSLKTPSPKTLKENKTKHLQEKLENLIAELWAVIDDINQTTKKIRVFSDEETISKRIRTIILNARFANTEYEEAKNEGILDDGIIKNKESLIKAFDDLQGYIVEYNKRFEPKLKTLKDLLNEAIAFEKKCNQQLYEEIFHEKMPKNKE